MATFAQLQSAVEGNLIDLPTFVADAVPGLINRAYRKAQSKHNFWIMRAKLEATTTVDTRLLVARPSNWKQWRGKPYHVEEATGTKRRMLLVPSPEDAARLWDTADIGEPEGLAEDLPADDAGTVNLSVYPLPDGNSDYSDGEYRVVVPYWKYLPELSADGDTTWLTVEGEAYLEAEATRYGFAKDWDEGRSTYWEKQAAREWNDLLLRDKYLALSNAETLAVHDGPYEPNFE